MTCNEYTWLRVFDMGHLNRDKGDKVVMKDGNQSGQTIRPANDKKANVQLPSLDQMNGKRKIQSLKRETVFTVELLLDSAVNVGVGSPRRQCRKVMQTV